ELVSAGVAGQATVATSTTEQVTFSSADQLARLQHGGLAANPLPVLNPLAPYRRGADSSCVNDMPIACDYWVVDFGAGVLQRNPAGAIPADQPIDFTYTYNARLLEASVGLVFSAGSNIRIIVHNVPSDAGPTLTTTGVSAVRIPTSPFPVTFWAVV